ncbi:hypothetical protein JOF34_001041 [Microbacterium amylolyticum]|uniref:Uncharacterized protein n=1 Tax=Microbacterium amylolyticum TaxID=936337 RepID=A0ABS4ZHJ0_9MICO|nr:hypothetical protein [Microbacterium amylolyticum]
MPDGDVNSSTPWSSCRIFHPSRCFITCCDSQRCARLSSRVRPPRAKSRL